MNASTSYLLLNHPQIAFVLVIFKFSEKEKEISVLKSEIEAKQKEISSCNNLKDENQREITNLNSKIKDMQNEITKLMKSNEEKQKEIANLSNKIRDGQKEITTTKFNN